MQKCSVLYLDLPLKMVCMFHLRYSWHCRLGSYIASLKNNYTLLASVCFQAHCRVNFKVPNNLGPMCLMMPTPNQPACILSSSSGALLQMLLLSQGGIASSREVAYFWYPSWYLSRGVCLVPTLFTCRCQTKTFYF